MRLQRWLLVVVLFAGVPCRVVAAPVALTEQQTVALFFQRNLKLIAARYRLDDAHAAELIAAAIPNPVFGFEIGQLAAENNTGLGPATMARFDQLIETAGKRRLRMASSALGSRAAEADVQDAVRVFANEVRRAYYALLLAQKNLEIALENSRQYQNIVHANAVRLKHGDIAESDFLRIEVESLKAESDVDTTKAALQQTRSALAVLLNWPDQAMEFVARDAWLEPPPSMLSWNETNLVAQALRQRPDLAAARLRIDQAQKNLILARKLRIPDVTVGVGFLRDPQNAAAESAMAGISVPLPIFYRNEGEIGKAAVGLSNAQVESQQAESAVRADVTAALAGWKAAVSVVDRFRIGVLSRVEKVRHAAELAYTKGATGILDLIDAQRSYRALQLEYHKALHARTLAYLDLRTALGQDVPVEP
jgi:outer membrane protein, heavy metal efflux system